MLDVIVIEKGQAREIVLDALRERGYDIAVGLAGGALAHVDLEAPPSSACHAIAEAVATLEARFEAAADTTGLYRFVLDAVEKRLIEGVLGRTSGNQLAAARLLGINRNALRSHIRRLGIDVRHYSSR